MGRTLSHWLRVALCAALFVQAAAAGTTVSGSQPLAGAYALTPQEKLSRGYAKVDATLAAISEQAQAVAPAQLMGALQAAYPKARFKLSTPSAVPRVLVDITVKGDPAQIEQQLRQLDAEHITVFSNLLSAWLPVNRIKDAAGLSGIHFMRASRARAHTGSITSQGDFVQRSGFLRASTLVPGLSGAGITVGVLSDSFDCNGTITSYATDVKTGDLPAGLQVLEEYNSGSSDPAQVCAGATDEGRAMLQIVYDVAPGATLKFHTAFNGEADFAQGIVDLAKAGATVIADDVGYFDEPVFQDGVVAQAVDQVKAMGVAYFSAAGNDARQSYEAKFADSGTVGAAGADNAGEKLMAFTSADGSKTQNFLPFVVPAFAEQTVQILQWDQPYVTGAPGSPGATSSLDICLTDSTGAVIPKSCSGATPAGTDAVAITGFDTDGTTTAYGLQIGVVGGTPPPGKIKIIFADDGGGTQADPAFATYSPTVQGHPGAAGANAVGASYFRANPVCLPAVYPQYTLESFSSAGGDAILFDNTGTALATPVMRQKPNFVAPDGGNTTFFAQILGARAASIPQCENAANTYNFFGTSAATPHAAGVAALLMQAQPKATPDLITKALQSSAIVGMATAAGTVQTTANFDTGYGFIQADAALSQVLPVLSLSQATVSFGDQRVGTSSAAQSVTLSNSGGFPATISAIKASGDFTLSGNTCPAAPATLAPAASCTLQITAAPTAAGTRSGAVTVTSDDKSSPDTISLSANGVQSKALLSPKSINFGTVGQGNTSGAQSVTLVNVGTAPLNISSISASDATFSEQSNCPAALAVDASCVITVTFTPQDGNAHSGAITLASDGAAGSDSSVALSGAGQASGGGGAFGLWLLLPGFALTALRRRKRV